MMKRRFTIGRFITRQKPQVGLAKVNHQRLWFVEASLNRKISFLVLFKSDGPVLIHCVDEGKTIDHNYYIENCLKSVDKEIWK